LDEYDVLIYSDVEAKNFQLAPGFYDQASFGKEVITFPDRLRLTVEAVNGGTGAMFLGGWLSFSGELGRGGWKRTRLREILPVDCLDFEDLVESTEGFTVDAERSSGHFEGLDLHSFPPILGYNETKPKEGCPVLLTVMETGDPLVATGRFGRGRTLAYTSDPAPHWGLNFVYWEHFAAFWLRCIDLVLPR
jgi:uncharacterized membrane protein